MIGRLRGQVAMIADTQALIDVAGVGYVVHCGARTLQRLAPTQTVEVFVETQMSESAIRLFGFLDADERAWFARLQDAPGVGARLALAILDVLPPAALMDAIALSDVTAISRAHGVGKKLAERIVTEFRGKAPPAGAFAPSADPGGRRDAPAPSGLRAEAVSALVNLGYGQSEAMRAVAEAARETGSDGGEAALIRSALRRLAVRG
jgi:Holliday junction DNA helicase RuvA